MCHMSGGRVAPGLAFVPTAPLAPTCQSFLHGRPAGRGPGGPNTRAPPNLARPTNDIRRHAISTLEPPRTAPGAVRGSGPAPSRFWRAPGQIDRPTHAPDVGWPGGPRPPPKRVTPLQLKVPTADAGRRSGSTGNRPTSGNRATHLEQLVGAWGGVCAFKRARGIRRTCLHSIMDTQEEGGQLAGRGRQPGCCECWRGPAGRLASISLPIALTKQSEGFHAP